MTPKPSSAHRTFLWLGVALVLATAGAFVGRAILRAKQSHTPIAAYLVPIDNNSRVKPAWWHSVRLEVARLLRSDEHLTIPAGSSVKLIHADSGEVELIAGPTKLFPHQKLPNETNTLVSPLPEVIAATQTTSQRPHDSFIVTSPVGKTRYLNPLITWVARKGVAYDVAVADSADPLVPLRTAKAVRPPVALADLQTPQRRQLGVDRNYEVVIREAGSSTIVGAARLLTTTDAELENQIPTAPADLIIEAATAMANTPTRTGDAWLALSRLPANWAQAELGVRLRLRVATELGLADELALAQKDASKLRTW